MSYDKLRERMCKELHDINDKDTFTDCDLNTAHKLIASIDGLCHLSGHRKDEPDQSTPPDKAEATNAHLSMEDAKHWASQMQNADGTTGPHWTPDQTSSVMAQRGLSFDRADFFVAMNMMYSDYCMVAKSYSADNPNFYADMAAAFLGDIDAVGDKIVIYREHIADHR